MAELNREQAVEEISLILQTAGYNCEPEEGVFNLSGVKGNRCLIVMCSNDINEMQRFDMTPYTIMMAGTKIRCDKLIFTDNTYFQPKESTLWTKETLLKNIAAAAEARIYGLPYDFESAPALAYSQMVTPDIPPVGYELLLPVRISAQDAARICHESGPTKLRMIPYWKYHYTSTGDITYKGRIVRFDSEGDGWINAVNSLDGEFSEEAIPTPGEIPADATVVEATVNKSDVRDRVMESLIKKLTKRVRIKSTSGDAIFAEDKEFKPSEDNIVIKVEKVFIPVWEIRGKKDIVEVNAFTGEELAVPSDEGCEVF